MKEKFLSRARSARGWIVTKSEAHFSERGRLEPERVFSLDDDPIMMEGSLFHSIKQMKPFQNSNFIAIVYLLAFEGIVLLLFNFKIRGLYTRYLKYTRSDVLTVVSGIPFFFSQKKTSTKLEASANSPKK